MQVDNVGRDLDTAIPRRHTGEAEDAVGPELGHRLERHLAVARSLEDEVDLTELVLDPDHGVIRDTLVTGAEARKDAVLQGVGRRLGVDVHLETA